MVHVIQQHTNLNLFLCCVALLGMLTENGDELKNNTSSDHMLR
jgi:hypothetical protein